LEKDGSEWPRKSSSEGGVMWAATLILRRGPPDTNFFGVVGGGEVCVTSSYLIFGFAAI
jgi:hypothetical protein